MRDLCHCKSRVNNLAMGVIPTKVGIQSGTPWIPAFAGMTDYRIYFLRFINPWLRPHLELLNALFGALAPTCWPLE